VWVKDCARAAALADGGMTWTEERIEVLTKLWAEGLSASQIAAELGGGASRNAVLGKAHRLGLVRHETEGLGWNLDGPLRPRPAE
jgi:GcrA cell cycle regulator